VWHLVFKNKNFSSCWAPQKQIVKGKELLEDLQRDSGVATTSASLTPAESRDEQPAVAEIDSSVGRTRPSSSSNNNSNSSILDLASSLQTQLSKFGHRLDDTRERLEDTSRCYELLDKVKRKKNKLQFFFSFLLQCRSIKHLASHLDLLLFFFFSGVSFVWIKHDIKKRKIS
jgi:hypothetical protein